MLGILLKPEPFIVKITLFRIFVGTDMHIFASCSLPSVCLSLFASLASYPLCHCPHACTSFTIYIPGIIMLRTMRLSYFSSVLVILINPLRAVLKQTDKKIIAVHKIKYQLQFKFFLEDWRTKKNNIIWVFHLFKHFKEVPFLALINRVQITHTKETTICGRGMRGLQ